MGAVALVTIVLVRAFDARRMGPLKPWMTVVPASELTTRDLDETFSMSHYDVNRSTLVRTFLKRRSGTRLDDLLPRCVRPYRLSVVTNAAPGTRDVVERTVPAGAVEAGVRPLGLGTLQPRGERAILEVPVEQLVRLTWNPFFPLVEERVRAWGSVSLDGRAAPPEGHAPKAVPGR